MSKTALSALLSRVNADNPSVPVLLTSTNCTFGNPTALSGDSTGKNTSVTVAGTGNPYTTAQTTLKYDRIDLTTLLGAVSNIVTWTTQTSSSDLLAAYNSAVGANLQASDIVVEALPTQPGVTSSTNYTLKASSTSLGFQGSVVLSLHNTVSSPLAVSGFFIPDATVGLSYNSTMTISGGTPPYSNPIINTALGDSSNLIPAGLALSINGSNLVLSGTPTSATYRNFYVQVTDSAGTKVSTIAQAYQSNSGTWAAFSTPSKPAAITLTNGNLTATRNDTATAVVTPFTSDPIRTKHYYEMVLTAFGGNPSAYIGVFSSNADSDPTPIGQMVGSGAFAYETSIGRLWSNGTSTLFGTTFAVNDVIGFAVDASVVSAVKVWVSKNGTWISGNPATGTSPMGTYNWTGKGNFFPGFSSTHGGSGAAGQSITLRSNPATFTGTVPTDFAKGVV